MKTFTIDNKFYDWFNSFKDDAYPLFCKIQGRNGVWLILANNPTGDRIYFHDPTDLKSQGYGGSTLEFPLEDGTVYKAKGPWHSNSKALLDDTGFDLENKHLTFVILFKGNRNYKSNTYEDVVYVDEKPIVGSFDRWKELAPLYPDAKYYYSESVGGSSSGPVPVELLIHAKVKSIDDRRLTKELVKV